MAKKLTTDELEPSVSSDIAAAIGKAVGDAITASKGRPKVSYGEYIRDPKRRKRELKKPAYQNGFAVNPIGLSDEIIDKLAELTPGKYLGGIVEVHANADGAINITYKCKTPDDRMTFSTHVSSFSDMVNKLYAEMKSKEVR